MRLLLIVLVAGLAPGCTFLDKTLGEELDDFGSWIASLLDVYITVGDIIIYIIAGFIILAIIGATLARISTANEQRRRAAWNR